MIVTRKTGEGYYLVSLTAHQEFLGRDECAILRKEILAILKPHREICINIKGFTSIDNSGYDILYEIKNTVDNSGSKLRFINVEPVLVTKISGLTERKTQLQKEIEIT